MKYIVTRTCQSYDEDPGCPGAVREKVMRSGKEAEEVFTIEINTMEELHQLMADVGYPIIVFAKSGWDFPLPELEIYDGYRE